MQGVDAYPQGYTIPDGPPADAPVRHPGPRAACGRAPLRSAGRGDPDGDGGRTGRASGRSWRGSWPPARPTPTPRTWVRTRAGPRGCWPSRGSCWSPRRTAGSSAPPSTARTGPDAGRTWPTPASSSIPQSAGRGVGRALAERVLADARAAGYRAMQFNAVVETNTGAVALWESLGFRILATVPEAFDHPSAGPGGPAHHAPPPLIAPRPPAPRPGPPRSDGAPGPDGIGRDPEHRPRRGRNRAPPAWCAPRGWGPIGFVPPRGSESRGSPGGSPRSRPPARP